MEKILYAIQLAANYLYGTIWIMLVFGGKNGAYYTILEIVMIQIYCIYLLARKKRIHFFTLLLMYIISVITNVWMTYIFHEAYSLFNSRDIVEAIVEGIFCVAKFSIEWLFLSAVRRIKISRSWLKKARIVVYAILISFFFHSEILLAYYGVPVINKLCNAVVCFGEKTAGDFPLL